jgi:hypothetical protein
LVAGYWVAIEGSTSVSTANRVHDLASASAEVEKAYSSSDKLAYEKSLWRYLVLLEAQGTGAAATYDDWVIATDIALTYARLADLASEEGLADKSRYLLADAERQCPRMQLAKCSQVAILELARRSLGSAVATVAH